jgi:arginyl-tRNA--protein-N-Asp/Glu arginylyltransferase
MKLLFSEHKPDHSNYIYPYAIWAFPETGEKPSDLFDAGFLPSTRNLDRFYLCRQVRVALENFQSSSENRRILRKGEGFQVKLVPRSEFEYTPERRAFYKNYADVKFGKDVMTYERLDSLFASKVVSHLLVFTEAQTAREIGTVVLYLEPNEFAFYYYSFYDLNHPNRSLGMFMMTWAARFFADEKFRFLYLGTCYSQSALYKTQFPGVQFFNGVKWSENIDELKYLVERGQREELSQHLLETEEFRQLFYEGQLTPLTEASRFRVSTCRSQTVV